MISTAAMFPSYLMCRSRHGLITVITSFPQASTVHVIHCPESYTCTFSRCQLPSPWKWMKYYCLPIQSFKLCTVYNKSHVESTTGLHDSYTVSVMLVGAKPSYSYNMAAACWTCHVAATTYSTFSRDRVSTEHLCLMPHSDHTAAKKKNHWFTC